jgi:hypothetical protein
MKAVKRNISLILIFFGLAVSTSICATEYEYAFGSGYETTLPSEQTAIDAGIFASHSDLFGPQTRGFEDGSGDPFDTGGGSENGCAYVDGCPVGGGILALLTMVGAYGAFLFRRKNKE